MDQDSRLTYELGREKAILDVCVIVTEKLRICPDHEWDSWMSMYQDLQRKLVESRNIQRECWKELHANL